MMAKNVAVVVAHPDDEVLGFGGTICRHADADDRIHILILATGLSSRTEDGVADKKALEALRAQARAASKVMGVELVEFSDFPDNRMDSVPLLDVIKKVEEFMVRSQPVTVYTHHSGDLNIDHQVCARAVLTACRPLPGAAIERIYAGEVVSSSEYAAPADRFQPTSYIGIAETLERKLQALGHYAGEIRPWPHPRSSEAIEALARLRGSECGLDAAEAFVALREISR